jgi:hypothetical protein
MVEAATADEAGDKLYSDANDELRPANRLQCVHGDAASQDAGEADEKDLWHTAFELDCRRADKATHGHTHPDDGLTASLEVAS